jgi:hypothetical protein
VTVAANDVLTLSGTGASIGALSVAQIAGLAAAGFDKINATDDVLTLSVAQFQALGTVELAAGDVVTLADTGANLAALSASEIAALADAGIDKIDATDNVLSLTVAQFQGLGTVELASGDVVTLADTARHCRAFGQRPCRAGHARGGPDRCQRQHAEPDRGPGPGAGQRGTDRQRHRDSGRYRRQPGGADDRPDRRAGQRRFRCDRCH